MLGIILTSEFWPPPPPSCAYSTKHTWMSMDHHQQCKSVDFPIKYLASGCQFICRYFYGRLHVEHFWKSRYVRVMLTDSTQKSLFGWLKGYMTKNNISPLLPYCAWFLKMFTAPVKITGNGMAAGCQLFYRKIYGYVLQCRKWWSLIPTKRESIQNNYKQQPYRVTYWEHHFWLLLIAISGTI